MTEARGIAALAQGYAQGSLDPVDVARRALDQARAPGMDAVFITLLEARALDEARASQARWRENRPLGPLDGVPLAWKDLFDMAGTVTTCASDTRRQAVPAAADAPAVRALAAAGMVSVGKTNLSEFAFSGLGINLHFGTPPNPHDAAVPRIPGGSSSGSAVAVARQVVPCAMGTDTSGSIRVPAALNGLVGWKPSSARYDQRGVFPLAPSLDSIGPLVQTVADACLIDDALLGRAPVLRASTDRPAARLVIPSGIVMSELEPGVATAFEDMAERLARRGFIIERRAVPVLDLTHHLFATFGTLVGIEAADVHRELLDDPAALARVDARIVQRLRLGQAIPARNRQALRDNRPLLVAAMAEALGPDEALLLPTVPMTAPPMAALAADPAWFAQCNARVLRNTMIGSYLDMPTLALPCGTDGSGLPAGMSLAMATGRDEALLALGLAVERELAA